MAPLLLPAPSSCPAPGPGHEGDGFRCTPLQSGDVSAHPCVCIRPAPASVFPSGQWASAACLLQVVCMSFFDIVLDFILMDAFEDLENPPSSVLAVLRNRWLSDSFKETVGGCPHS